MRKPSLVCAACYLIIGMLFYNNLLAQGKFQPYSSVSIGGGSSQYLGELSPYNAVEKYFTDNTYWNISTSVTRYLSPKFSAKASFCHIKIGGDDYNFYKDYERQALFVRNDHFNNNIKEFSLVGIYNFQATPNNFLKRSSTSCYLLAGIAVFTHNPVAKAPVALGDKWIDLQPLGTEGQNLANGKPYSLTQWAIPFGFGIRQKITKNLDLSAEFCYRITFTDYLDDIGTGFVNPNQLTDPIARQMANRIAEHTAALSGIDRTPIVTAIYNSIDDPLKPIAGNPFQVLYDSAVQNSVPRGDANHDAYFTFSFQLHYYFGKKLNCPAID